MIPTRALPLLFVVAAGAAATLFACESEDPTKGVLVNAYPEVPDGGDPARQIVVYKAWWGTTLFNEPLVPGASSEERRVVPEFGIVYALLAPGWDPESGVAPTKLVAMRSKAEFGVTRSDNIEIPVSDATFFGLCDSKQALTQEDADFVTQRIFPGDFADVTYDAATCTSVPVERDAGLPDEGGADAGEGGADASEGGTDAGPG